VVVGIDSQRVAIIAVWAVSRTALMALLFVAQVIAATRSIRLVLALLSAVVIAVNSAVVPVIAVRAVLRAG
jgi:hypothetical protein